MDGHCDRSCNNKGSILDGLDCDTRNPELSEGTLVIVLMVSPVSFLSGSRTTIRELSRELRTIAFIKNDSDGNPIVKEKDLMRKTKDRVSRSKENLELGRTSVQQLKYRSRRDSSSVGSEVHMKLDSRGCTDDVCLNTAAKYLGARASQEELHYTVVAVKSEKDEGKTLQETTFNRLWLAMLCVGIPLCVVGVLAGGKTVYARLWLPDGFIRRNDRQRGSLRREPVGEDHSLRNVGKSITQSEEAGAAVSRMDLTPPQDGGQAKRVCLDEGQSKLQLDEKGVDHRQWTQLHREAADVNVRSFTALALTPPQEGDPQRGATPYEVNAKGPGGFTALHLASCRGPLVDGACVDDDSNSDDSGGAMVSDLLSLGAKSNCRTDNTHETPLHLAARYSRADAAKRLLDAGADANARDKSGRTPLHQAVGADAQGVFQILLRTRATELEAKDNNGTTPLILAAKNDMSDMVKELITANANVNNTDQQGKTALHWAVAVDSLEITKELLRSGAKKDQQDEKGQTPLFLGAREGRYQTVRFLLCNYANRKIADNMNQNPEGIARERMHDDIVELLTDWSLGCRSPIACTQSTPFKVVTHILVCSAPSANSGVPKGGARANTASAVADVKRKRKKQPRTNDQSYVGDFNNVNIAKPQSSLALSPSSLTNGMLPSTTGASFSPLALAVMSGLSQQDSKDGGISPPMSTTLSPPQPNSFATNLRSPPMLESQHNALLDDVLEAYLGHDGFNVDGSDFFHDIQIDQDSLPRGDFLPPVGDVYDTDSVPNIQDPLLVSAQDSRGGGISPTSTTLSPPQPNSLATNPPSPPMLEPQLNALLDDVLGAEPDLDDFNVDGIDFFNDIQFDKDSLSCGDLVPPVGAVYNTDSVPNIQDPLSGSCQVLPITQIDQQIGRVEQAASTTSDYMYVPRSMQRRENANYQRL